MTETAHDRFMANLDPAVIVEAERIVTMLRPKPRPEGSMWDGTDSFMNGWLAGSVAMYLEAPWWSRKARKRLAVDLLVVRLYRERSRADASQGAAEPTPSAAPSDASAAFAPESTREAATPSQTATPIAGVPLASSPAHKPVAERNGE